MKASFAYPLRVVTTGFMVLVLFAVVMLCGRFLIEAALLDGLPQDAMRVEISPSGLLPASAGFDPNAQTPSQVKAGFIDDILLAGVGLVDYVMSKSPGGGRSDVFYYENAESWLYFDRDSGQLVCRRTDEQAKRIVTCYAGPDGISDFPDAEKGRFADPILTFGGSEHFVYDRTLRRFSAIDWRARHVRTGPPLEDRSTARPVSIGSRQRPPGLSLSWQPPTKQIRQAEGTDDSSPRYKSEFTLQFGIGNPGGYLPVVDASGRIDLLDGRTLSLIEGRGYLPAPMTLYGQGSHRPSQVLDYDVHLVGVHREAEYLGMVTGSVSRQGTSMTVAVYDESGKQIKGADTRTADRAKSAEAALFDVPWGPALAIGKYSLETVHPPALAIASFFAANDIDARASHRTVFLLPNSFAAMHRDRVRQSVFAQLAGALWTMAPAFLLAGLLTWRVTHDASRVGLSSRARAAWIVGTLAFGLPAYITYRLTRPKAVLVTCANCGLPRRPDLDRCHHCGSPWRVPELVPPAWRVLDGGVAIPEPAEESEKVLTELEQKGDSPVETL